MLTYTDIQRLASEGEGKSIEFKETTRQLDRGMETLCAFLNGNGGTLLFGITDNGKIIVKDGVVVGNKLSLGCGDLAEYYVEVDYEEIQKEEAELI